MQIRNTKPSKTNKYFIHVNDGGYNHCIRISIPGEPLTCLPNCVGYANGRYHEHLGRQECDLLPTSNANTWYPRTKLKKGYKPKVGAVMCWDDGEYGHVAIVEQVISDTKLVISDSVYGGDTFRYRTVDKKNNWGMPKKYKLQGFIYNKMVSEATLVKVCKIIAEGNPEKKKLDFNGDGKVDSKDIITFTQSLY